MEFHTSSVINNGQIEFLSTNSLLVVALNPFLDKIIFDSSIEFGVSWSLRSVIIIGSCALLVLFAIHDSLFR